MSAAVELLLQRAGLPASAAELVEVQRSDVSQRLLVESLYAVAAARYADPALVFSAEVTAAPWHERGVVRQSEKGTWASSVHGPPS